MKIVSWNVNGLRSVYRKGFLDWLAKSEAGVVCLREVKAREDQLPFDLTTLTGYHTYFNSAEKKGYSGVGVYSRTEPLSVKRDLGLERFDSEGRLLQLEYKDFILLNLYIPHGGRDKENLDYKLSVYEALFNHLNDFKEKNVVLTGDFNIAHKEIDLAHPQRNQDNIMFTKEERKKIDNLISLGFVDSFRRFNQEGGNYTWWRYGNKTRERNLGWRIDYIFASKSLAPKLQSATIYPKVLPSDHCPVEVEISKASW